MNGYSDRINHAFAFAAKHHDQQVRKGTRPPYLTRPANVAVILSRYDRDDDTVVAGILRDVVADFVREGHTLEMLDQRLGQKFGADALEIALAASERRIGDDGAEMSATERKGDLLQRLRKGGKEAHWVSAADELHALNSLLSDLRRTVEPAAVWRRFMLGKAGTIGWHREHYETLRASGFDAPIMQELRAGLEVLETFS
jgi:(p)ppGpp synthase/HD superfamily hydrolase